MKEKLNIMLNVNIYYYLNSSGNTQTNIEIFILTLT